VNEVAVGIERIAHQRQIHAGKPLSGAVSIKCAEPMRSIMRLGGEPGDGFPMDVHSLYVAGLETPGLKTKFQ